jgi:hypothetical protein
MQNRVLKSALSIVKSQGLDDRIPVHIVEQGFGGNELTSQMLIATPAGIGYCVTMSMVSKTSGGLFTFGFGVAENGKWEFEDENLVNSYLSATSSLQYEAAIAILIQAALAFEMVWVLKTQEAPKDELDSIGNHLASEWNIDSHGDLRENLIKIVKTTLKKEPVLSLAIFMIK